MPRTCTVCAHPECDQIDAALVAATGYRDIAGQFGVSKSAVQRHQQGHLPAILAKAKEGQEVARADSLLDQVRELKDRALAILGRAEEAGDLRNALAAIREARGSLELLSRLLGELQEGQTVNILVAPEWVSIRGSILLALAPYPEAHQSVVEALNGHAS